MFVGGQPINSCRNGFADCRGWLVEPAKMCGKPVEESVSRAHRGRLQQRIGAGKVAVDGLPCDTERPRDIGDAEISTLPINSAVGSSQNASYRFLVGRRRRARPTVSSHVGIVRGCRVSAADCGNETGATGHERQRAHPQRD